MDRRRHMSLVRKLGDGLVNRRNLLLRWFCRRQICREFLLRLHRLLRDLLFLCRLLTMGLRVCRLFGRFGTLVLTRGRWRVIRLEWLLCVHRHRRRSRIQRRRRIWYLHWICWGKRIVPLRPQALLAILALLLPYCGPLRWVALESMDRR